MNLKECSLGPVTEEHTFDMGRDLFRQCGGSQHTGNLGIIQSREEFFLFQKRQKLGLLLFRGKCDAAELPICSQRTGNAPDSFR